MAIYLKYDGWEGSIEADGYKNNLDLISAETSAFQGLVQPRGRSDNRRLTEPTVNSMTCRKKYDKASHSILQSMWKREAAKTATLTWLAGTSDSDGDKEVVWTLKNALVDFYQCEESPDGETYETFSLYASEVTYEGTRGEISGEAGSPKKVGFDLTTGKKT